MRGQQTGFFHVSSKKKKTNSEQFLLPNTFNKNFPFMDMLFRLLTS